jgi:hypothetical protein
MIIPPQTRPLTVGDFVFLRRAAFGVPGRIVGVRKRLRVFWPDLGYTGRYSRESLILAWEHSIENPKFPPNPASCAGPGVTLRELSVTNGGDNHAG